MKTNPLALLVLLFYLPNGVVTFIYLLIYFSKQKEKSLTTHRGHVPIFIGCGQSFLTVVPHFTSSSVILVLYCYQRWSHLIFSESIATCRHPPTQTSLLFRYKHSSLVNNQVCVFVTSMTYLLMVGRPLIANRMFDLYKKPLTRKIYRTSELRVY